MRATSRAAAIWLGVLLTIAGCGGPSADQLASEVEADIQRTFAADPETRELRVLNVELVRESDRVYRGFVDLGVLGDPEQERLSLRVTVDGESLLWEIEP